jgi:Protein of unknown function (DUF2877)
VTRGLALQAESVGASAALRLGEGSSGVVQGVFSRAVNVLAGDGIVCLVTRGVGRGPVNIVVGSNERVGLGALGLSRGMPVRRIGDRLAIGGGVVSVELGSSEVYQPTLPRRGEGTASNVRENLDSLKRVILSRGDLGGLGGLLPRMAGGEPIPHMSRAASAALPHVAALVQAFETRRVAPIIGAARRLIGLGPGLTPAADDTLSGLMIAFTLSCHAIGQGQAFAAEACESISSTVEGRTTRLSREFLIHAARGLGSEHTTTLVKAILSGSTAQVEQASLQVLRAGATSGTDTAVGVFLGVAACFRTRGRQSR